MFRTISVHIQEDTVVYMQHMVLSLCKQVSGRVLLKHDFLVITIYKYFLLIQSALQRLWVITCSTIVEYSQQEGFLQSAVASGTSNPPTWRTSD